MRLHVCPSLTSCCMALQTATDFAVSRIESGDRAVVECGGRGGGGDRAGQSREGYSRYFHSLSLLTSHPPAHSGSPPLAMSRSHSGIGRKESPCMHDHRRRHRQFRRAHRPCSRCPDVWGGVCPCSSFSGVSLILVRRRALSTVLPIRCHNWCPRIWICVSWASFCSAMAANCPPSPSQCL